MNKKQFVKTELYRAMMGCGRYGGHDDAIESVEAMIDDIENGESPEEVLHQEGFEPDYFFDLMEAMT